MGNQVNTITTKTPELEQVTAKILKKCPGFNPHRVRNRALAIGMSILDADPNSFSIKKTASNPHTTNRRDRSWKPNLLPLPLSA